MKKHIKLFEDFNPEDFLEDFGITTFSIKSFLDKVHKYNWRTIEIRDIILNGKATFEESNISSIIIKSTSKYFLYNEPGRLALTEYMAKYPKYNFLNINWTFKLTAIVNTTNHISLNTSVSTFVSSPKISTFTLREEDFKDSTNTKTMERSLFLSCLGFDNIIDYKVARGLNSKNIKDLYLNTIFANYLATLKKIII